MTGLESKKNASSLKTNWTIFLFSDSVLEFELSSKYVVFRFRIASSMLLRFSKRLLASRNCYGIIKYSVLPNVSFSDDFLDKMSAYALDFW